jgi:hypothetical protein
LDARHRIPSPPDHRRKARPHHHRKSWADQQIPAAPAPSSHATAAPTTTTQAHRWIEAKLPQVLIGFDQDPPLAADITAAAAGGKAPDSGLIFDSNTAILESLILGGNYLAPLLGCCSPRMWAVQGQRLFGVILFALGRLVPGIEPTPVEPLQLMPYAWPHGAQAAVPTLAPKSCAEAIDWWGLKLQQMFAYLSDPTYFRDANHNYLPYLHQNWMMTFDQVFQRLGSITTSYRDVYAQQVLMFGAMDAIGDRIYGCGSSTLALATLLPEPRARCAAHSQRQAGVGQRSGSAKSKDPPPATNMAQAPNKRTSWSPISQCHKRIRFFPGLTQD